jgi:hypothetical protein
VQDLDQTKGKYFIGLSNGCFDDDLLVCFVLNTEHGMDKYKLDCNPISEKFIIPAKTFSFITDFTAIMLHREVIYYLREMYEFNIRLLDKASDVLSRQIKNCICRDHIAPKMYTLITDSFK